MRIFVFVLLAFLSGYAQSKSDDSGVFFVDRTTTRQPNTKTEASRGEDDEVSGSGVMSDGSGGSGESSTTEQPSVDVKVYSPSTKVSTVKQKEPATIGNRIPETEKSEREPTTRSKEKTTSSNEIGDMNAYGGGIGKSEKENDESKVAEKREYKVLTTEVVAAIVVGAVCAIILIAFLVYRLRKRDEGSYALTDGGYNDTYKLRGEGKEAFV